MWQTKYALAVPKNLGLGLNFRPCSEGYFPLWASVVRGIDTQATVAVQWALGSNATFNPSTALSSRGCAILCSSCVVILLKLLGYDSSVTRTQCRLIKKTNDQFCA